MNLKWSVDFPISAPPVGLEDPATLGVNLKLKTLPCFYKCSCFILHVFMLKPDDLPWHRWSSAALLSIVPKHSSVDSRHYSVDVSAICKWWLIIYHCVHQSSKLVVFSRPLPLPRTMGPFPVGCMAEEGAKQASIVKQGHHISVSGPWNETQIQA